MAQDAPTPRSRATGRDGRASRSRDVDLLAGLSRRLTDTGAAGSAGVLEGSPPSSCAPVPRRSSRKRSPRVCYPYPHTPAATWCLGAFLNLPAMQSHSSHSAPRRRPPPDRRRWPSVARIVGLVSPRSAWRTSLPGLRTSATVFRRLTGVAVAALALQLAPAGRSSRVSRRVPAGPAMAAELQIAWLRRHDVLLALVGAGVWRSPHGRCDEGIPAYRLGAEVAFYVRELGGTPNPVLAGSAGAGTARRGGPGSPRTGGGSRSVTAGCSRCRRILGMAERGACRGAGRARPERRDRAASCSSQRQPASRRRGGLHCLRRPGAAASFAGLSRAPRSACCCSATSSVSSGAWSRFPAASAAPTAGSSPPWSCTARLWARRPRRCSPTVRFNWGCPRCSARSRSCACRACSSTRRTSEGLSRRRAGRPPLAGAGGQSPRRLSAFPRCASGCGPEAGHGALPPCLPVMCPQLRPRGLGPPREDERGQHAADRAEQVRLPGDRSCGKGPGAARSHYGDTTAPTASSCEALAQNPRLTSSSHSRRRARSRRGGPCSATRSATSPGPLTTANTIVTIATRARPPSAIAAPMTANGTVFGDQVTEADVAGTAPRCLRQAVDVTRVDAVLVEPVARAHVDGPRPPT